MWAFPPACEFKAMPMKMDGVDIIAGIAHTNSVALALFQVKRGWALAGRSLDKPLR